jgi:hypothetical protein
VALQFFVWTLATFSLSLSYTQLVRLLGRVISPSQGRYLHTGQHKQNKRTQTSRPWFGFEPTTPEFYRAKTVHVSDRRATVIGMSSRYNSELQEWASETHKLIIVKWWDNTIWMLPGGVLRRRLWPSLIRLVKMRKGIKPSIKIVGKLRQNFTRNLYESC